VLVVELRGRGIGLRGDEIFVSLAIGILRTVDFDGRAVACRAAIAAAAAG